MFLDMYYDSSNVVFEKGAMFHFAALKWAVFCFVFVTFMKIVSMEESFLKLLCDRQNLTLKSVLMKYFNKHVDQKALDL